MSDELAIMVAATSDPEFKDRLAKLREERATIKREREAQQEEINQNAKLLVKAQEERAKAEAVLEEAKSHEAKAAEGIDNAALAFKRVQEEEARFEAGRALVEKQHAEQEKTIGERERAVEIRVGVLNRTSAELNAKGAELSSLEKRHAAAGEHARKFLAALNARGS